MKEYLSFLPIFQQWQQAVDKDEAWRSFQYYTARVDQMFSFLDILWPEFIEFDGLILRRNSIPTDWNTFQEQAQKAKWSLSDIEYIINHFHIMDLFLNDPDRDAIEIKVFRFLAYSIADMWKCRLQNLFPDRAFVVGVANADVEPEIFAYLSR